MTGKRPRVVLALALALAATATAAAVGLAGSASADASDCHAQQTCPSADHSYVWSDGTTQWDCGLYDNNHAQEDSPTLIVYDGTRYACFEVPTGTTTTTPEPPAPPPTTPPDKVLTEEPSPPPTPPASKPKPAEPSKVEPSPYAPRLPVRRPKLPAGRYAFPVDGPSSYSDTFGSARSELGWHHGEDIFAPLGTPLVAVADGTLLKVGWNAVGGNRLWLRDSWGNYFYYAHLSGFAPGSVSGAPVFRGEVIGYVGNTGDAAGTPYHLHFEIHPATMLDLGYDGVVNPTPYLRAWQHAGDLVRTGHVTASAPTPGAILLTAADISSASGLQPQTVIRRASAPVANEREELVLLPLPPPIRGVVPGSESQLSDVLDSAASSFADVPGATVWDTLAECESSGDWHANTGIYDGGVQFHPDTWRRYGGTAFAPFAYLATREQQITIARRVLAVEGWQAWPACSLKLGLR
jgi:murein DD-endopeptidase MepM/ murein hydrolase activator NlpD